MDLRKCGFVIEELIKEKDALDLVNYKDEGCEVFSSCLSCPLPHCLEEGRGGRKKFIKQSRNERIMDYHDRGKSSADIATLMGVSQRTVQRVVSPVRKESNNNG